MTMNARNNFFSEASTADLLTSFQEHIVLD
jgi:hypothetical protein